MNQYIKEFEKTLEIPKSLNTAASILLPEGREFWRFFSELYTISSKSMKLKLRAIARRYEERERKA